MYEIKSNPLSLYTVSPLIGARPRRLIWSTRWGGDQEGGSGKQQQHLVPWQRQKSPRFRRSTFCSSYQTLPIVHYVKLITVKKRNRKQESTHYVSSSFQLTLIGTRSALWYSTLIYTQSSYERCILTTLTCTFHHLDFNTLTCMVHAHYPAHRSVSLDRSIL